MENPQRDSFIFYRSFFESISDLAPEDQIVIYSAICSYALNGSIPDLQGCPKAIFKLIKPILDANFIRYENGRKGGRPKKDAENGNQNNTNQHPNRKPKQNRNQTNQQPNKDEDVDKDNNQNKDNDKEPIEIFEEFRLAYPSTKRGLKTEFENFKKKHADWLQVIPLLMPAINELIKWRGEKIKANQFVPEYANLSTWLNQRRWETELETFTPTPQTNLGPDEFIRDGCRYYGDPRGESYPVPINAPPRPSTFHGWSNTRNEWVMN